jgi:hypothetical protein
MLVSSWGVIDPILGAEEVSNSEMSKGTDKKKKKSQQKSASPTE